MTKITPAPRHVTLDVLRGIAVMGILTINISAFALPDAAYFSPAAAGGDRVADHIAWSIDLVLFDGKMRNLFSFLFGASLLLVAERARTAGENAARVHYARMGSLLVIGLAHFYLLWSGDILAQYAVIGMVAFLFHRLGARWLLGIAVALLAVQFVVTTGFAASLFIAREAALATGADPAEVQRWAALSRVTGSGPGQIETEIARYRGGYADIVAYRLDRLLFAPAWQLLYTGAETLALVLLGMAGYKSGFVIGGWDASRYRRVATLSLTSGIAVMVALLGWCIATRFDGLVTFATVTALSAPARPVIMLGYAALAMLWLRGHPGWLAARIGATGRMAFTNYLATSLVMTTVFYGYGLGLFGALGRADLIWFVLAMWAAMLAWSKPWLDRFVHGPAEWAWRSLARGRIQAMRRA